MQSRYISNRTSCRDCFNVDNLPDYFEIHRVGIKSFSAAKLNLFSLARHSSGDAKIRFLANPSWPILPGQPYDLPFRYLFLPITCSASSPDTGLFAYGMQLCKSGQWMALPDAQLSTYAD